MNTTITFLSLWDQNIKDQLVNKVQIPIIQRDYAQGRQTKRVDNIRRSLLDAFYDALVNNNKIELDFIYGDLVSDGTFIPLDGQQRLTTLYLLHWYIARHEDIEPPACLKSFSYETRFSSREFCEKILMFTPTFADTSEYQISKEIKNQPWFERSWGNTDPTIKSMLVMIEAIHEKFKMTSGLWEKIIDNDNPLISFHLLLLESLSAPEDIYVKMNARGKELTEFEHFKAYLEDLTSKVDEELSIEFSRKIDTIWTDLFWKYRIEISNGKRTTHLVDNCLLRYYRFATAIIAYQDSLDPKTDKFTLAKHVYGKENPNAKENLNRLISDFDCWQKIESIDNFFDDIFSNENSNGSKIKIDGNPNLLCSALWNYGENRSFTLTDTILLYGIIQLIKLQKNVTLEIKKIRQLRNMIWQSTGNEVREESMVEILSDTQRILFDNSFPSDLLVLNKKRAKEEIEKEIFITQYPNLFPYLCNLEDHDLLLGRIGVIDFDSTNFEQRALAFLKLFTHTTDFPKIACSLLTFSDYSQIQGWGSRISFGGRSSSQWSQILTNYDSDPIKGIKFSLQSLLDWINNNHSLEILCKEFIKVKKALGQYDWTYYFVNYPVMLTGLSGLYVKSSSFNIRMLEKSQLNGYHRDTFLSALYNNLDSLKDEFDGEWFVGHSELNQRLIIHKKSNLAIGFDEDGIVITAPTRNKNDSLPKFEMAIASTRGVKQISDNEYYFKTRAYDENGVQLEFDKIDRVFRATHFIVKFLNEN